MKRWSARAAVLGAGLILVAVVGTWLVFGRRGVRPNVLVVTIDTLRADHLGCYGRSLARTRAIDRLAAEGVRFTNDVTTAPITMPAHSSIFTGLFPPAHGVRDNGAYSLGDGVVTLAERMKAAGYATHAVVSAVVLDRRYNLDQGFDEYDDDLWSEDQPSLFMIRDRPAWKTAARVVGWLEGWAKRTERDPFFLWVHFFDPHQPHEPRLVDAYLSPTAYDGEIAAADGGVGTIVDFLRTKELLDDTLVVLTADHGESLGEHGEATHALFVYDATVRVPLVMRYPSKLPKGALYEGPARAVDVMPTILGLLGLPGADETQGADLGPAILGRVPPPDLPQYSESLLAEVGFGMAPLFAVRSGGRKWIRAPKPELYDLAADPKELVNRVGGDSAREKELDGLLEGVLEDSWRRAIAPGVNPLDRETMENLRALGYVASPADRAAVQGMDPKDGLVIHRQLEDARHLAQRGNWAGSSKLLREILAVTPRNVSAWNVLGLTEIQQGHVDEAEAAYRASLAEQPGQYRVLGSLAQIEMKRGNAERAETLWRQALGRSPDFVEAMADLGFLALRRHDAAAAQEWHRKAMAADPSFPRLYRRYADLFFEQGDWKNALDYYRRTLDAHPGHFEAAVQAANSARELGDAGAARGFLAQAATSRPDSWIPSWNLACLEALRGTPEAAIAALRDAVARGFADPERLAATDDFASLRGLEAWGGVVRAVEEAARRRPGIRAERATERDDRRMTTPRPKGQDRRPR